MKRSHFLFSAGLVAFSLLCNATELRAEESEQKSEVIMKIQTNTNGNQLIEIPLSQIKGISVTPVSFVFDFPYAPDEYVLDVICNDYYRIYFRDIERISYENRSGGISEAEMNTTTLHFDGDNVVVFSVNDNSEFVIYSTDGKICLSRKLPYGQSIVSLAELPGGVYILSFDNQSFKFAKK